MPADSHSSTQDTGLPVAPAAERRSRVRFPLELALRYRTLDRRVCYGSGRTLNISSTGILAESPDLFTPGTTVELTADWPVQLHDWIPLHLVMTGSIVRCESSRFAVAADRLRLVPGHPADAPDVAGRILRTRPHRAATARKR
jgi:hypothetical protein